MPSSASAAVAGNGAAVSGTPFSPRGGLEAAPLFLHGELEFASPFFGPTRRLGTIGARLLTEMAEHYWSNP